MICLYILVVLVTLVDIHLCLCMWDEIDTGVVTDPKQLHVVIWSHYGFGGDSDLVVVTHLTQLHAIIWSHYVLRFDTNLGVVMYPT